MSAAPPVAPLVTGKSNLFHQQESRIRMGDSAKLILVGQSVTTQILIGQRVRRQIGDQKEEIESDLWGTFSVIQ